MSDTLIRVIPIVGVIGIFLIAGLFVLRAARNQQSTIIESSIDDSKSEK